MSLQRNHYEVLGVPQNATTDQIKKKYRELARKFHPDVVEDKALGQKVFSQINQAYRALGDPERRAHYDATLAADAAARPAGTTPGSAVRPSGMAAPTRAETVAPAAATISLAEVPRLMAEADRAVLAGKMTDARLICEKVVKADPRNAKAWEILGDALRETGSVAEAANAYRSSLQITPSVMVQAKLNRLQAANGARPSAPAANGAPRPAAPTNGARTSPNLAGAGVGGVNRTQPTTDPKPAGGLLGRLLGRK